ncbi:hypothetical protein ACFV7Q_31210 [Streptomyces sp. NPDC059851]|uniref:hypothetical protein n=1 Tax=Streptomyces sp. NPDC059851 TaxID=3346971 RepID=UPI00364A31A1
MHAFTRADIQAGTALPAHAARTAELAAEAAAGSLARPADPTPVSALRNRLGEALVRAGNRLMQPGRVHAGAVG